MYTNNAYLGQRGDVNSAYARDINNWNNTINIKAYTIISLNHLLSILIHTYFKNLKLPLSLINVCQKDKNESNESVEKRHSEHAICLRFLFDAIVLYGNNLSMNNTVYFGCNVNSCFGNVGNNIILNSEIVVANFGNVTCLNVTCAYPFLNCSGAIQVTDNYYRKQ